MTGEQLSLALSYIDLSVSPVYVVVHGIEYSIKDIQVVRSFIGGRKILIKAEEDEW